MNKLCGTCKFFGTQDGLSNDYSDGDNEDLDAKTEHHNCARIIHGNTDQLPFEKKQVEPAVVVDGSGYSARLKVLPTFGCTLHEEKV